MPISIRAGASLPLLFVLFFGAIASAQAAPSITIVGVPARTTASGALVDRPAGLASNVVNYSDCIADESIQLRLALNEALPVGIALEAWAGEGSIDCAIVENRNPATAQCWPLGTIVPVTGTSFLVNTRVEDAIAQFGHAVKTSTTHGNASDCGSLAVGPHAITLQFMATSGTAAVGSSAAYSLIAATNTGSSRSDFTVHGADGALTLEIESKNDPAFDGYDVYCEPQPFNPAASEGGAQCSPSILAPQSGPYGLGNPYPGPPPTALLCGQIAPDVTTATITGLTNGVTYAIAMTGRDVYGNQGNESPPQCATPLAPAQPAPGSSSGCSMSPAPSATGLAAALLGLVTMAVTRIRRKRNVA